MKLTLFKGENLPVNYPTENIILTSIREAKKHSFDTLLINFTTLVRNYITALSYEEDIPDKSKLKYKELKGGEGLKKNYELFKRDLELINTILNDNNINFAYYMKDYKKVGNCLNNYLTIDKLPPSRALTEKYSKSFYLSIDKEKFIDIKDDYIDESGKKYLLMTHNGVDLVKYQHNSKVKLIESFTGEIKPYDKWYTKYRKIGDRDMSILPFNSYLLPVLGCNNYIKGSKIKLRRNIYELAKKGKWNSSTPLSRIKGFVNAKDPILHRIMNDLESCLKKI